MHVEFDDIEVVEVYADNSKFVRELNDKGEMCALYLFIKELTGPYSRYPAQIIINLKPAD